MRHTLTRVSLVGSAIVLSGCAGRESADHGRPVSQSTLVVAAPATPAAAAPPAVVSESAVLADARMDTARFTERFATPDVVFRYERGGRVVEERATEGAARVVRIEGPRVSSADGPAGGSPVYVLNVSWYSLAPAQTLEAWARAHADADPDDEAEEKAAAGGPPVPPGPTSPDTLSGRPALAQVLAGPDAELYRRYVAAGPWVLVFRYDRPPSEAPTSDYVRGPLALMARLEWPPHE